MDHDIPNRWQQLPWRVFNYPRRNGKKMSLKKRYGHYQQGEMEMHDWREVHDALREK